MVPEEKDSSRSRVSLVESDGSAGQPAATRGGQSFACKTCAHAYRCKSRSEASIQFQWTRSDLRDVRSVVVFTTYSDLLLLVRRSSRFDAARSR